MPKYIILSWSESDFTNWLRDHGYTPDTLDKNDFQKAAIIMGNIIGENFMEDVADTVLERAIERHFSDIAEAKGAAKLKEKTPDYRLLLQEVSIDKISNAIHAIMYADEWLSILATYKNCVGSEIPAYLEEHSCAIEAGIEAGYEHLSVSSVKGDKFYECTQDEVVESLHLAWLADWGLSEEETT